ncbi:hypothetical protein SNEBB_011314 [Seison nebaliae]|nr:hypothetical protein SNEBB_011314 [Seison nebaliae]
MSELDIVVLFDTNFEVNDAVHNFMDESTNVVFRDVLFVNLKFLTKSTIFFSTIKEEIKYMIDLRKSITGDIREECEFSKTEFPNLQFRLLPTIYATTIREKCDNLILLHITAKSFVYHYKKLVQNLFTTNQYNLKEALPKNHMQYNDVLLSKFQTLIYDNTHHELIREMSNGNERKPSNYFYLNIDDINHQSDFLNKIHELQGNYTKMTEEISLTSTDLCRKRVIHLNVITATTIAKLDRIILPSLIYLSTNRTGFIRSSTGEVQYLLADGLTTIDINFHRNQSQDIIVHNPLDISLNFQFYSFDYLIDNVTEDRLERKLKYFRELLSSNSKEVLSQLASKDFREKHELLLEKEYLIYFTYQSLITEKDDLLKRIISNTELFNMKLYDRKFLFLHELFKCIAYVRRQKIYDFKKKDIHPNNSIRNLLDIFLVAPKMKRIIQFTGLPALGTWYRVDDKVHGDYLKNPFLTNQQRNIIPVNIVVSEPFIFKNEYGSREEYLRLLRLNKKRYLALETAGVKVGRILKVRRECMSESSGKYVNRIGDEYFGYVIDMMLHLADRMNLVFDVCEPYDGTFGILSPDNKWNGALRTMMDGKIDLILTDLTRTADRARVIDYTAEFFPHSGISLVWSGNNNKETLFNFVKVFDGYVWLYIGLAIMLSSVITWFFEYFSPHAEYKEKLRKNSLSSLSEMGNERNKDPEIERIPIDNDFTLVESLWSILGSFLLTEGLQRILSPSTLVYMTFFWFFTAIVVSTYQANLAARLTVSRLQQEYTIDEMIQMPNKKFFVENNSVVLQYFENMKSIEELFTGHWQQKTMYNEDDDTNGFSTWTYPLRKHFTVIFNGRLNRIKTVAEVVEIVKRNKNAAGFMETAFVEYQRNKDCALTTLKEQFSVKTYGFGVRQGVYLEDDSLLNSISFRLRQMQENKTLTELKEFWWSFDTESSCKSENTKWTFGIMNNKENSENSIDINTIGGTFILLAGGIILAFVVCIIQWCSFNISNRFRINHIGCWRNMAVNFMTKMRKFSSVSNHTTEMPVDVIDGFRKDKDEYLDSTTF